MSEHVTISHVPCNYTSPPTPPTYGTLPATRELPRSRVPASLHLSRRQFTLPIGLLLSNILLRIGNTRTLLARLGASSIHHPTATQLSLSSLFRFPFPPEDENSDQSNKRNNNSASDNRNQGSLRDTQRARACCCLPGTSCAKTTTSRSSNRPSRRAARKGRQNRRLIPILQRTRHGARRSRLHNRSCNTRRANLASRRSNETRSNILIDWLADPRVSRDGQDAVLSWLAAEEGARGEGEGVHVPCCVGADGEVAHYIFTFCVWSTHLSAFLFWP